MSLSLIFLQKNGQTCTEDMNQAYMTRWTFAICLTQVMNPTQVMSPTQVRNQTQVKCQTKMRSQTQLISQKRDIKVKIQEALMMLKV